MAEHDNPNPEPEVPLPPDEVRILHLSDLHAGRGFQESRWNDLLGRLGGEIVPRVVILSGDLVNSPTRNEFKRARECIAELKMRCPAAEFVVLPGNHDVRIWGILRVPQVRRWLLAIFLVMLVLAGLAFLTGWSKSALVVAGLALISLILLAIARFYYVSFEAHFPPQGPVMNLDQLGLDLLLFDSASDLSAHWAEGVVSGDNFVAVRTAIEGKLSRNFRIAVLHHHALPIPHEAGAEPMMVLKNAGAFLSEISGSKVALVLHGHRHSPSFSRVSVNADGKQPFQIGVLSTGSVTSGDRDAARLGHSFSVVDVNRWGNARITRYQSDKGALFVAREPFMARSIAVATSEFFAQNALVDGCNCESIRINIQLTPDGDAKNRIDHLGFTVKRDLAELPHEKNKGTFKAVVTSGQIERVRLVQHNFPAGFSPRLVPLIRTRREYSANLQFGSTLKPAHDPVDFSWQRHMINSFAMSVEQYQQMYDESDATPVESTRFSLRHVPTAELIINVQFPPGFAIDGEPALGVFKGLVSEPELAREYGKGLSYDRVHNVIHARIPHPPLDFDFLVEWRLCRAAPPAAPLGPSAQGRLHDAIKRLLQLDPAQNLLKDLCDEILKTAVELFRLVENVAFLSCSIMAYDRDRKGLRVVAATYPSNERRWMRAVKYGDGVAGRAYKMRRGRVFVKQKAIATDSPFYYVVDEDEPVSEDGHEIPLEVLISLPLFADGNPDFLLGVLNLGSKAAGSKLADLNEDALDGEVREFVESVGDSCLKTLEELPSS